MKLEIINCLELTFIYLLVLFLNEMNSLLYKARYIASNSMRQQLHNDYIYLNCY